MSINIITPEDTDFIMQWLNCDEASVDAAGDVWVSGPMTGHWLSQEKCQLFLAWRNASKLERIGHALYGPRWQSDISRDLGVGDRRIRQWMAGERPIPSGIWSDLRSTMELRLTAINSLLKEIS